MANTGEFEVALSDGATLNGRVTGQGVPVLWVSGLSGVASFWQAVCPKAADIMSITFDQRGLGGSKRGTSEVTVDQLALDALAVLDKLNLEHAHVVGHSTGGCIALTMALTDPKRVRSMVLTGSWAGPHKYLEALFGLRMRLLQTDANLYEAISPFLSNTPKWLIDHPDRLRVPTKSWSKADISAVKERIQALMNFDRREAIKGLGQRCLVLGAHDDLVIPLFLQEELAQIIPNATSYFFEYGGHFFPQSQSDGFASLVSQWIESQTF